MKNPTAILCSDFHIRDSTPECRTDDFMEAQRLKFAFLKNLQIKHNIPILVAGDLFHHWKPSPWLLGWCFDNLPDKMIVIPGQHDLSAHNLDNISKAGIYVLAAAGKIILLTGDNSETDISQILYQGFPWCVELKDIERGFGEYAAVALIHKLVYQGKPPFPGAENYGGTGKALIKQMPGFDLLLTGDNHQTFVERFGETILVNAGSFTRQSATQIDHKPCVFLWDAETNEVEQVFLPINKDVISRDHIEIQEERNERIEAFVSSLSKETEIVLFYEENMKKYLDANKISKDVQNIIWGIME